MIRRWTKSRRKSTNRHSRMTRLEHLEDRRLMAADLETAGSLHGPGCACPGCCPQQQNTPQEITALSDGHFIGDGHNHGHLENDALPPPSWWKDVPDVFPRGGGGPLTIILDFNDPGQANTSESIVLTGNPPAPSTPNVVGTWDHTRFSDLFNVSYDRATLETGVLNTVQSHFSAIDVFAQPSNYALDIQFEIGNVGTPPANGSSNFYYLQIGDQVSGPAGGLGVAWGSSVRGASGAAGYIATGGVFGSVFTEEFEGVCPPSVFGCNWSQQQAIDAIAGVASHEIGHGLSLLHVQVGGATTPNGLPPIMSTGAIDRTNEQWYSPSEFANSALSWASPGPGQPEVPTGNSQQSINQLMGAVGLTDTDGNDQLSEAIPVSVPGSFAGTIDSGDVDMIEFSVTAGQIVGFDIDEAAGNPPLDSYLRLFDSGGNQLAFNDDGTGPAPEVTVLDSYFEYYFATSGTYYVGVSDLGNTNYDPNTGLGDVAADTGGYTMNLTNLGIDNNRTIAQAQAETIGSTPSGTISPSIDVDMFSFAVGSGEQLQFDLTVTGGSDLDSALRLFDASGNELASDSDFSTPDAFLDHTFANAGTYYIGVSDTGNFSYNAITGAGPNNSNVNETGTYTLAILDTTPAILEVSTTVDESDGNYAAGDLSLREAIELANANPGLDDISFDTAGVFATPQTIALNGNQLVITEELTINGPGADLLTIDAQGGSRVFNVDDGVGSVSTVTIRDVTMTGGSSANGGAIFNFEDLRLHHVTFEGNTATGAGGAIRNENELRLENSTLFGNSAAQGGAISHSGGQASVFQSTISGNTASRGGGIDNYFGDVDVRYSTITQNQGGGTWSFGNSSYAEIRVKQSIISGNSGGDVNRHGNYTITTYSDGYNIVGNGGAAVLFNQPGDMITTDPQLRPLSDNGGPTLTHRPRLDSPAINAGDPAFAAAISDDQRGPGFDRVSDGRIDIGAVEANFLALEVNTTSDVAGGGGGLTLRDAITMANAHNDPARITFDTAGVFSSPQTIAIANELPLITDDITITGPGADTLTIDAEGVAPRIFHLSSAGEVYAVISGLTLTGANGSATAGGGAILNREHLTATGLVITDNLSSTGGGILNSGDLTLLDSTLSGNTATGNGGAIYSSGTTDVQIINSTISGNTASGVGGGIRGAGYGNLVTIASSTFSNNSASTRGGGVDVVNAGLTIDNSIVAGNLAPSNPDITTTSTAGSYNLIGDGSGLGGFTGGNIGNQIGVADPGLAALADNGGPTPTHALLPGSPAINSGEPGFSGLLTDQRGEGRVSGGIVDIGSVEAHPAALRDLGTLAQGATHEAGQALRAQEVFFYRFELTEDVLAAAGDLFVIDTIGSSVNTAIDNDTEIALFRGDGAFIDSNDSIDFGGSPQIIEAGLTFGIDSTQQTSSGDLPAGEYYLALTTFDSSFAPGFSVIRGDAAATGTIVVNFNLTSGTLCEVAGDLDCNGHVGASDLDLVLGNWGVDTNVAGVPAGWVHDLPDGVIGADELDNVLGNWGNMAPPLTAPAAGAPLISWVRDDTSEDEGSDERELDALYAALT